MNRYSMRLAWAGTLIGVLTLSAVAAADLTGLQSRALRKSAAASETAAPTALAETASEPWEEAAVPAFAPAEAACFCDLHVSAAVPQQAYVLEDLRGTSRGTVIPDGNRAALGPLMPGRYRIVCGRQAVGSFRVTEAGTLTEAGGRLWTDGVGLWLEDFSPGAAELRVRLPHPGYYSFQLSDDLGQMWSRDVFVPENAAPDPDGSFCRTLRFDGLPEGRYTLVRAGQPLTQFRILAGGTARIDVDPAA